MAIGSATGGDDSTGATPYVTLLTRVPTLVALTTVALLWPLLLGGYVEYGIAPWALTIGDLQGHSVPSVWYVTEAVWSVFVLAVAGRTQWLSRTT